MAPIKWVFFSPKLYLYILIFILFLFVSLITNAQKGTDTLTLTNGDTLTGKILSWEQSGLFSRKKVIIELDDGSKWNYFIKNVKSFIHKNEFYKPLPKKPNKNKQNLVFTKLIMVNDSVEVYKYDDLVTTDFGPVYDWKYYLYIQNVYQTEVNRKNYKHILEKYFNDCSLIEVRLSENKNHFRDDRFSDLAKEYMNSCR